MKNPLMIRIATILILVLIMLVPLGWITDLIDERSRFRETVRQDIASSWTGAQSVTGPLWVIPYRVTESREIRDEEAKIHRVQKRQVKRKLVILPQELEIQAVSVSDIRYRGLHEVPVYTSRLQIRGSFMNRKIIELATTDPGIEFGSPYIAVAIRDIRGVSTRPQLEWSQQSLEFQSGSRLQGSGSGMHAPTGALPLDQSASINFSFELELRGMESLMFTPVGETSRVSLSSNWLHPAFVGQMLPQQRTIDASGFEALWQASSFSTGMRELAERCERGKCKNLVNSGFGVVLKQPVDIYQLSSRSSKYGLLFVGLTFIWFLVFETLRRQRLHPVQYLFTGSALAVFFLLLISLSEHTGFEIAYAIATVACTGLLTLYTASVFRKTRYGLLFGAAIAVIYGLLFVIIRAEDAALLMGSLLIFILLAGLMTFTRKVDWYQYDAREQDAAT